MPRKEIHILIPFIFILFIWFIAREKFLSLFTGWTFLIAWFLFLIGSIAPDYIEPSRVHSFRHRRFFHSRKLLKIISIVDIITIILWLIFKIPVLLYVGSFLLGYVIHLLLDSMTKMGLPSGNPPTSLMKDEKII
jgi:hypothetical protein